MCQTEGQILRIIEMYLIIVIFRVFKVRLLYLLGEGSNFLNCRNVFNCSRRELGISLSGREFSSIKKRKIPPFKFLDIQYLRDYLQY